MAESFSLMIMGFTKPIFTGRMSNPALFTHAIFLGLLLRREFEADKFEFLIRGIAVVFLTNLAMGRHHGFGASFPQEKHLKALPERQRLFFGQHKETEFFSSCALQ